MHKILQNHLLCAFVGNLKIDALYTLYPESFCGKNLAIQKALAFCDSECLIAHIQCVTFTPDSMGVGSGKRQKLQPAILVGTLEVICL